MVDLTQAKEAFLDDGEPRIGYDKNLLRDCIDRLSKYTDPAERRDILIRDRAQQAITSLQKIHGINRRLASGVELLLLNVQLHAIALTNKSMMQIINRLEPLSDEDLNNVDVRIAWAIHIADQSIMAASKIPYIRRATMTEFTGGNFVEHGRTYLNALILTTQDELRPILIIKMLTTMVPGLQPLLEAAQFIEKVHEKAKTLSGSYRGRGAEDKMLEFARRLDEENIMFEGIIQSLDASHAAIMQSVQST